MSRKWVDNSAYFGPDRRQRPGSKRWGDRRRDNEAGSLPPLGALLRRLRVHLLSASPGDRARALQLLAGALGEANRLGYRRCAEALQSADRALREGGGHSLATADARLVEAMAHFGLER